MDLDKNTRRQSIKQAVKRLHRVEDWKFVGRLMKHCNAFVRGFGYLLTILSMVGWIVGVGMLVVAILSGAAILLTVLSNVFGPLWVFVVGTSVLIYLFLVFVASLNIVDDYQCIGCRRS